MTGIERNGRRMLGDGTLTNLKLLVRKIDECTYSCGLLMNNLEIMFKNKVFLPNVYSNCSKSVRTYCHVNMNLLFL